VETAIQHMLEEKSVIMEEDDAVYLRLFITVKWELPEEYGDN